jgi:pimeloyl-ACP methyl ester carboxylesterase
MKIADRVPAWNQRFDEMTRMNEMSPQSLSVNGVTFACRVSGQGDPMVLVHPSISDMRSWESLEPLLATHFRVLSYSRRYAHPNRPIGDRDDDPLVQHAHDLIGLIEKLALGKVHLVGNSSGAFVCLLVAHMRPDLVRSLTLEEPPVVSMFLRALPPPPGDVLKLLFSSPAALFQLIKFGAGAIGPATKAFQQGKDEKALGLFARGVLGDAAFARLSEVRWQQMRGNLKPHRAALLGSGLPNFTPAQAAAIRVPTQLVHGAETPAFQRLINQRLAHTIPGATDICVPNASHFVHEDNPQAVAEIVRSFCTGK